MIGPRAVLMMKAVFFISRNSRAPIWCRVSLLSGECSETKSDFAQQLVERHVSEAGLALFVLRLAARRPIQHPHRKAVGAPRHRLADQAAAADEAERLAADERRRADAPTGRREIFRRAPCGRLRRMRRATASISPKLRSAVASVVSGGRDGHRNALLGRRRDVDIGRRDRLRRDQAQIRIGRRPRRDRSCRAAGRTECRPCAPRRSACAWG